MIQIIALIYASEQGIEGLRTFESQAIPILKEHSGKLISASFNTNKPLDEPDEIHVIQFPNTDAFNAYKNDPRLQALRTLKHTVIAKMEMYVTNAFHQY